MNLTEISDLLAGLTDDFTGLLTALENEQRALRCRDAEQLAAAAEHKQALCRTIEQKATLFPHALADQIDALPADAQAELRPRHKTLMRLAREAQDFNAVNGMVIQRSQQSVRELIGIVSGLERDALYGAHGAADPAASAAGTAIARA